MRFYLLVAVVIGCRWIRRHLKSRQQQKHHAALAAKLGCLPPPLLQTQLPLGVDVVYRGLRADAESRLLELFLFFFRKTGYTLEQNILCTRHYGTVDPENLKAILSSRVNDWNFGPRREITFDLLGDGIFTQEGRSWEHSKKLLKPHVSHRQYEDLGVFDGPMSDLLDALPQHGSVVDLQPIFFRFSLDVTTAFLFGKSIESLKSPEGSPERAFADNFDIAQGYISKRFRFSGLFWLFEGSEWKESCRKVQAFADQIIKLNLLDSRLDDRPDDRSYSFLKGVAEDQENRASLRGQIINMLIAGRDTTACLLSWTFYLLVRHPRVMKKLRSEISNLDTTGHPISRLNLRKMKYLHNVLKETLRLYPPIPLNTRQSNKITVLPTGGGPDRKSPILVPKGSPISFSTYSLHRRPDLYGMDAECFRPERWDEDLPLFRDRVTRKYGYLPFSAGPRVCLGMDFALAEAEYTVVRMFQRYPTIKLPAGEKAELLGVEKQTVTLVLQIAGGCKVELGG